MLWSTSTLLFNVHDENEVSETMKPFWVGLLTSRRTREMNTIYLMSSKLLLLPSLSLANFIRRRSKLRTRLQSHHHLFSIRIQHRKDISLDTRRAYLCACRAFAFGFSVARFLALFVPPEQDAELVEIFQWLFTIQEKKTLSIKRKEPSYILTLKCC